MNALQWNPRDCFGQVELPGGLRLELAIWERRDGLPRLSVGLNRNGVQLWVGLVPFGAC